MNYTTNYHLPQWVESDRIMMEDFNDAMEKIDQGIAKEAADRAEAIQNITQSGEQTQAEVRADMLNRLRRSGYDIYQVAGRGARGDLFQFAAKGMVINTLHTAKELERADECIHLEKGGIQIGPSSGLTLAKINATAYDWTVGEAPGIADEATASVKFRSIFRGTITKLNVWYHRTNSSSSGQLPLYVKLFDQDTGSRVYQSEEILGKVLGAVDTVDTLTVAVPIRPNRHYRLELYTEGDLFTGTIGFGTRGENGLTGEVTAQAITACSVTDQLTLDIPANQAVAVVHYSGGSKAPTVTLGGQAMTAREPRTAPALDGTNCTELEFFLEKCFTGQQTLVTSIQGNKDMKLYDTGAYFI